MESSRLRVEQRLSRLFEHLAICRAHIAGGYASQLVAFASAYPARFASLALVCPNRFVPNPLERLEFPMLFVHGDTGANASNVPRAMTVLPGARQLTLKGFADAVWSDPLRDRLTEIEPIILDFLENASRTEPLAPLGRSPSEGEYEGFRLRIQGHGPPLVLMPLNLSTSQWEPLLPALTRHFTTIVLGGVHLGFVAFLEQRFRGGYGEVVRAAIGASGVGPAKKILEVGCGTGALARWLAAQVRAPTEITAVDVSTYLLEEATALARSEEMANLISFQRADAEHLPYPPDTFDLTVACTLLEEVDANRVLSEMVRVTRPGGRVVAVVRATDMPLWVDVPVARESLAKMAAAPGSGVAARGCADASLYERFRSLHLRNLCLGPQFARYDSQTGDEYLKNFCTRIVQVLSDDENATCHQAVDHAVADGTFQWAEPFHCASGTRSEE